MVKIMACPREGKEVGLVSSQEPMCKVGTEGRAVSKDQIRKTLLTAETVKHVRLGSEGLHIPLRRLQK